MRIVKDWLILMAILLGFSAIAYAVNRLSTQWHPYGNWVMGVGLVMLIAGVMAWFYDQRYRA